MDEAKQYTCDQIEADLFRRYPQLEGCRNDIVAAEQAMIANWRAGGKLLVCGNGGSAADSEHVVGELMKSFRFKRSVDVGFSAAYRARFNEDAPAWLEGALPAISLVSQSALMTAFSNDEAAMGVFAQQVYGYGCKGDVLLGISTSGNSENVVQAAKVALAKEMTVIALTGESASKLSKLADVCIRVPETEVFKVQELHLPIYHMLCAAAEAELF